MKSLHALSFNFVVLSTLSKSFFANSLSRLWLWSISGRALN